MGIVPIVTICVPNFIILVGIVWHMVVIIVQETILVPIRVLNMSAINTLCARLFHQNILQFALQKESGKCRCLLLPVLSIYPRCRLISMFLASPAQGYSNHKRRRYPFQSTTISSTSNSLLCSCNIIIETYIYNLFSQH